MLARGSSAAVNRRLNYELYAVMVQSGAETSMGSTEGGGGHYYAFIKDFGP